MTVMGRAKGCRISRERTSRLPEDTASPEEMDELIRLPGQAQLTIVDQPSAPNHTEGREEAEREVGATPQQLCQPDDGVKIYLRQMSRIPLLTRAQALALAQKIEAAERAYREQVLAATYREVGRRLGVVCRC